MKRIYEGQTKFLFIFASGILIFLLLFPLGCGKKSQEATDSTEQVVAPPTVNIGLSGNAADNIIHVSDIHFNPFFDPELISQLLASEAVQWDGIFNTSTVKGFGKVGSDETNYSLLVSAMADMAAKVENPDFILFTGDFIAHDFPSKFEKYAPGRTDYDEFVEKTVEFVVLSFAKYFPGKPVYICLGNNDCYDGDYQIIPNGKFLKNTLPVFSRYLFVSDSNRNLFTQTYAAGGYFAVEPEHSQNTLILSLNTIFFSPKHKNTVDYDPGIRELDWFEKQLVSARQANKKIWILLHIPPGADVYSTLHHNQYTSMWVDSYNQRFIQLITAFAPQIKAGFCGHMHMDDFRVLIKNDTAPNAIAFLRICPAISPQFGNNPGYQQYSYYREGFSLINYVLNFLNLEDSEPTWSQEYTFGETYGQAEITADSLENVFRNISANPSVRGDYMKFYNVSDQSEPDITTDNWTAYWCGIANWTQSQYEGCQSKN